MPRIQVAAEVGTSNEDKDPAHMARVVVLKQDRDDFGGGQGSLGVARLPPEAPPDDEIDEVARTRVTAKAAEGANRRRHQATRQALLEDAAPCPLAAAVAKQFEVHVDASRGRVVFPIRRARDKALIGIQGRAGATALLGVRANALMLLIAMGKLPVS